MWPNCGILSDMAKTIGEFSDLARIDFDEIHARVGSANDDETLAVFITTYSDVKRSHGVLLGTSGMTVSDKKSSRVVETQEGRDAEDVSPQ